MTSTAPGMKVFRTAPTEGDDYREGTKNSTKSNIGKNTTISIDDGYEDDEIEEETIIVRKKVVKPGKKKLKNIVSLR